MKYEQLVSMWATLFCTLLIASAANAQQRGVSTVAVVDLETVGKQHEQYQDLLKKLRSDWAAAEKEMQERQDEVTQMQIKLQTMRPGSPEQIALQQKFITEQTKLSVDLQQRQIALTNEESRINANMFRLIHREIKKIAETNGIRSVMQHKSVPVQTASQDDITYALGQYIIYHDGLDITSQVSKEVNKYKLPAADEGSSE